MFMRQQLTNWTTQEEDAGHMNVHYVWATTSCTLWKHPLEFDSGTK